MQNPIICFIGSIPVRILTGFALPGPVRASRFVGILDGRPGLGWDGPSLCVVCHALLDDRRQNPTVHPTAGNRRLGATLMG